MKINESGQGLVEYGIILVLAATIVISAEVGGEESARIWIDAAIEELLAAEVRTPTDIPEMFEGLEEFVEAQQNAIEEINLLSTEALDESLEVLVEWDGSLLDESEDLQEAVLVGELEAAAAIVEEMESAVGALPDEVVDGMLFKTEPLVTEACQGVDVSTVPDEPYDIALQAIIQLENEEPESTGDAIPLMLDLWDDIELGNEFLIEFNDVVCSELDP